MKVYETKATTGSRKVITTSNDGVTGFSSRLYVNNGETATTISANHQTLKGAQKWAAKVLAR